MLKGILVRRSLRNSDHPIAHDVGGFLIQGLNLTIEAIDTGYGFGFMPIIARIVASVRFAASSSL